VIGAAASAVVTAVLLAVSPGSNKPVAFAAYFTAAGPMICAQTAEALNDQRQDKTDPEFYCNE